MNVPASKLPSAELEAKFLREEMLHERVGRIEKELVDGFHFISHFVKSVTIFGSARFPESDKWYREAQKMGRLLAEDGFAVVTGGGPGIMEAGNRGAHEANGESAGINILLPSGQRINPYVNEAQAFHYFFTRKLMMSFSAQAYVYFPGGFGTLDEFFEIITLIQTKKIATHIPVILVGRDYWSSVCELLKELVYDEYKAVDKEDLDIFTIVDSAEEAMDIVRKSKPRNEV